MPELEPAPPSLAALPEAWFRALFDHAPTAMAVMSPRFQFHVVNTALARMLGRPPEELRGMRMVDVTHPDDVAASVAVAQAARRDGAAELEKRYLRPDGTIVWGRVTAMRWLGPDGAAWVLVGIEDVTARKEAESALQEREIEFGALFDEAPFAMAVNDPEGRFRKVNRAFCELLGYGLDEVRAMRWVDVVHPLDRSASLENQDRERTGDAWERDVVRRVITRDGRTAWLRCKGHVVRADDGTIRYCIGQFVDLTPVRRHEEERRMLEDHLRRSQQTETVGRLAGGIVHDFNNMLSVILNVAELARLKAPDTRSREFAEQIHAAAARAATLSRRLMSVGRQDVGTPELLDVNTLVAEIRQLLQRVAGEDISFSTDLTPGPWSVRAVRPHLEQALFNLVVNARDAMPVGGQLTVRTRNVPQGEVPGVVGPHVLVEVEDTGTGVPADVLPHVFEPFFTTKEPGKGTGLGLSMVKHVVTASQGTVRLRTHPGEGTTFSVFLPAVPQSAGPEVPPETAAVHLGRGERVLVVEDEVSLLDLVVQLLADHGYVPLPAPGAEPALELARSMKNRIDLLLTDVVMPGASGVQLAEALAATHPEARVLLMSGHPEDRVARHASAGPRPPMLRKPFTAQDLLASIRSILDSGS